MSGRGGSADTIGEVTRFAPGRRLSYDRDGMETAVTAFRQFLTAEKRASEHTVRAYLHDLDELIAFARKVLGRAPDARRA